MLGQVSHKWRCWELHMTFPAHVSWQVVLAFIIGLEAMGLMSCLEYFNDWEFFKPPQALKAVQVPLG